MNQRLLATAVFAVCGGALLAMPAFAQTDAATQTSPQATATTASNQATATSNASRTSRAVPPVDSRTCIRDTGSHIPPPPGECLPVAGNSYSQKDLQNTGAIDIGRALQMLDPSVTVRGH